ncbi:MAG: PAS domain S-box protein [Xanthomonadales bacterium]|nr:PAS domain S-box protein [Xanthomonadales bacterium]
MTAKEGTREAGNAFDALLEAAVDGIIIIDEVGTVLRFNQAAERIFGYTETEISGGNIKQLMPEPDRGNHDAYLSRYMRTGKRSIIGGGREVTGLKKNGDTFPMFLSVGETTRQKARRYVGIIRDLSDVQASREKVRELEEQLLHADRLVILGELTAGIAHEINQPLTAIAAYADAGKRMINRNPADATSEIDSICERIAEQSRRAAAVVQRLRKLVRSGTVSKGQHDINQIIKNTLLLFEYEVKKSNIELSFYPLETAGELYVDEIHIQQIIVNLIKNSIDAISEAGSPDGRIEIRVMKRPSDVTISVSDNGPGVREEFRKQLFESFFTTKPKGVGLGLSICKTIAGAHGGSLTFAESTQGGSTFTLSLPLELIG